MKIIKDGITETGAVIADCSVGQVVRLWAALPLDGRTLRAVRRFFPCAEERGGLLRLGGWSRFAGEAVRDLADAKMTSCSAYVQALHLVSNPVADAGLDTIRQAGRLS